MRFWWLVGGLFEGGGALEKWTSPFFIGKMNVVVMTDLFPCIRKSGVDFGSSLIRGQSVRQRMSILIWAERDEISAHTPQPGRLREARDRFIGESDEYQRRWYFLGPLATNALKVFFLGHSSFFIT